MSGRDVPAGSVTKKSVSKKHGDSLRRLLLARFDRPPSQSYYLAIGRERIHVTLNSSLIDPVLFVRRTENAFAIGAGVNSVGAIEHRCGIAHRQRLAVQAGAQESW